MKCCLCVCLFIGFFPALEKFEKKRFVFKSSSLKTKSHSLRSYALLLVLSCPGGHAVLRHADVWLPALHGRAGLEAARGQPHPSGAGHH